MKDLWGQNLGNHNVEESEAVELLRAQAKLLKERTNGIISATFSKTTQALYEINVGEALKSMKGAIPETDRCLEGKKDINTLYRPTTYKFEVFDDTYKFKVFEIHDKKLFPIHIYCDYDILSEISEDNPININSNARLEEVVGKIFASKKMQSVLSNMMKKKTGGPSVKFGN